MKTDEMDLIAEDTDTPMLRMDGYDDCCIGVMERFGMDPIFCYSIEKVIKKMMTRDRMSEQDAYDFFYFNQIGAWMGDGTPCFISHEESR